MKNLSVFINVPNLKICLYIKKVLNGLFYNLLNFLGKMVNRINIIIV